MDNLPPIGQYYLIIGVPAQTLPLFASMNNLPIGHLISDIATPTLQPPPVHMDSPSVPHHVIDIPTEPKALLPAAVEAGFKLHDLIPAFLTTSFTLIATSPHPIDPGWGVIPYAIEPVLSFVSAVSIIGLIFYSCRRHHGAELPMVQETVMGFSAVLLVFAGLSRLVIPFPRWLSLPMVAIMVILIGLLFLLLYFIWHRKSKRAT